MTNEGWSVASVLWRSLGSLSPITPDPSTFFKPQGWLQVTSQWNNSYTMAITVLFHTSSHCGWIVVVDLEDLWAASNKTRNLLNSCILSKWITLISNFFFAGCEKDKLDHNLSIPATNLQETLFLLSVDRRCLCIQRKGSVLHTLSAAVGTGHQSDEQRSHSLLICHICHVTDYDVCSPWDA